MKVEDGGREEKERRKRRGQKNWVRRGQGNKVNVGPKTKKRPSEVSSHK
jgi:hypothetical protein